MGTTNAQKKRRPWLWAGRVLFTVGVIATVIFIFSNSMQVADVSGQVSGRVLRWTQTALTQAGFPGLAGRLTDHIIRKLAHFAEYMMLGFWLMLCLRVYTRHVIRHASWPVLLGLLIAMTDETIQLSSAGRSSQITDVWIDFGGTLTGLVCGLLLLGLCRLVWIAVSNRDKE